MMERAQAMKIGLLLKWSPRMPKKGRRMVVKTRIESVMAAFWKGESARTSEK